jgi:Domain of unknown function (DUF927)
LLPAEVSTPKAGMLQENLNQQIQNNKKLYANYIMAFLYLKMLFVGFPVNPPNRRNKMTTSDILKSIIGLPDVYGLLLAGTSEAPSQALAEEVRKFREEQLVDQHESTNAVGRAMYFKCFVPEDYKISSTGIWITEYKYDSEAGCKIPIERRICGIRIMVTGRYTNDDEGESYVRLTYIDKQHFKSIYCKQSAILGYKEFKAELRSKLRIDDKELKDMIPYFNACIETNENEGGTAYEEGVCYSDTGFVDNNCTAYKAGTMLIVDEGGKAVKKSCLLTDVLLEDVFNPIGTWQEFVAGIKPIAHYPRVRFAMYVPTAALLCRFLGLDPYTVDFFGGQAGKTNDRSGSGKSTMTMVGIAQMGNVVPQRGLSLFNSCRGTNNFVGNILVKFNDMSVVFDESTKLSDDDREELAYMASEKGSKGRASDGIGGVQKIKQKYCIPMVTGEKPLVTSGNSVGTRVRVLPVQGGIGESGISEIVTTAGEVAARNSGHFLFPILREFYARRSEVRGIFEASRKRLIETTDKDMVKRMATKYALLETAGWLAEPFYERVGLGKVNHTDVVNELWQEGILENEIQPAWREALEQTHEWYEVRKEKYFRLAKVKESTDMSGNKIETQEDGNQENYGWIGACYDKEKKKYVPCLNLMTEPLKKMLKENDKEYDATVKSWIAKGIANEGEPNISKKTGKSGKPRITVSSRRGLITHRVVQLKLQEVSEELGLEMEW